ncbi:MAG: HTH domain-containing protein, partial [bacterium]|nr:HTH domain-containing protein [bacterium]
MLIKSWEYYRGKVMMVVQKKLGRVELVREMLLSKKALTAAEVATSLGISRRTVYRYMDRLKADGLQVSAFPGSTGG